MAADLQSIVIYWGALLLTLFLLALYSRYNIQRKYVNLIWMSLICLPLSLVAGLRVGVGTDYVNYLRIFGEIEALSLFECLTHSYLDVVFAFVVRLLLYVSSDAKFVFFVMAFIMQLVMLLAVSRYRKQMCMPLFFVFYYLIIYHPSLNVMRQCLAISFVILALVWAVERKYLRSLLLCLVSCGIHSTSIIGMAFILVVLYFGSYDPARQNDPRMTVKRIIYYAAVLIGPFLVPFALRWIVQIPFFADYAKYVITDIDLGVGRIFYFAIYVTPLLICWKTISADKTLFMYTHVFLLYLTVAYAGYYFEWASRLNLYTLLIIAVLVPLLVRKETNKLKALLAGGWYSLALFAVYAFDILKNNYGETFPYVF